MHLHRLLLGIGASTMLVTACGDDDSPPLPRSAITVVNQTPTTTDVVRIDEVLTQADGFIAIVQRVDGGPSDPTIGLAPITATVTTDLDVALERPVVGGETLYARLHVDSDEDGNYEWTPDGDVDPIVKYAGSDVIVAFTITSTTLPIAPSILVDDQDLANTVTIKSAVTSTAGFVVVREDTTSDPLVYGVQAIEAGLNPVIAVALTATTAAPVANDSLEAIVIRDEDQDGEYDPAIDMPVMSDGEPVSTTFTVR